MRYLLLLLFFACASGQLMAEEMTTDDFAAGYYLETSGGNALYSLELPKDVYRTVRSAELSDLRVFNGAGEVVPHELRAVVTDPATLREKEIIPFFPLMRQVNGADDQSEFSLNISRNATGALVNIQSDSQVNQDDNTITGYLLDLSHVKNELSELVFSWRKDQDSAVFTVDILGSNDLERWTPLVHRATLAELQFAGQQVQRKSIKLPNRQMKYLKLSWQGSHRPVVLAAVTGFSPVLEERKRYQWVSLADGHFVQQDSSLQIEFRTDYRLPASSVQLRFTQTNSIAMLAVQSRADADKSWRMRCEQVFFDLRVQGTAIRNEPCIFQPTADVLWRVVVKEDGAGFQTAQSAPTMQLGWQPSELVFMGRGDPPYLLAFGSGRLARQEKKPHTGMLSQAMQVNSTHQAISPAHLCRKIVLGGESALQEPVPPISWRQWLLWLVLVLGVGLLFFMAKSLMQEMKTAEEKTVAGK